MPPEPLAVINSVVFFGWIGLFLPWNGWRGWKHLQAGRPLPPKVRRFWLGVLLSLFTVSLALNHAQHEQIPLPIRFSVSGTNYALGTAALLALAAWRSWRKNRSEERRQRILRLFRPESRPQYVLAILIGLVAGATEEVTYRCVLFQSLSQLFGSFWTALLVTAALFSLAHITQGWRAALSVAYFGLIFQMLYLLSHNLYVPMLAHAVYDIAFFTILYTAGKKEAQAAATAEAPAAQAQV